MTAKTPEDVFGTDLGHGRETQLASLKASYRKLVFDIHPDRNADPDAALAFDSLSGWLVLAERQIESGTYGRRIGVVTITTRSGRAYSVTDKLGRGDIADVFRCSWKGGEGVLKVARRPHDNDLIRHEHETILRLHRDLEPRETAFIPVTQETVAVKQSGGITRQANVLDFLDGFVTLEQVMGRKGRIDPRDMAWMWRRLLFVIGAAHNAGVMHGAVLPPHVMVHPEEHGLVLIDWCYSAPTGRPKIDAVSRAYKNWYPAEVLKRERCGPETDIFMGARTMLALCGGADGNPPLSMPSPLRAFFRACLLDRRQRPDDAWKLQETFDEVLERCYGPRKFRPFSMHRR